MARKRLSALPVLRYFLVRLNRTVEGAVGRGRVAQVTGTCVRLSAELAARNPGVGMGQTANGTQLIAPHPRSTVVGAIYDSAIAPERRRDALRELGVDLRGMLSAIYLVDAVRMSPLGQARR